MSLPEQQPGKEAGRPGPGRPLPCGGPEASEPGHAPDARQGLPELGVTLRVACSESKAGNTRPDA